MYGRPSTLVDLADRKVIRRGAGIERLEGLL